MAQVHNHRQLLARQGEGFAGTNRATVGGSEAFLQMRSLRAKEIWTPIVIGCLCFGVVAPSAATDGEVHGSNIPRDAVECPKLLGDAAVRGANRRNRRRYLYWIDVGTDATVVAHGSDSWEEPEVIRFRGIDLLASEDTKSGGVATAKISATTAQRFGCHPGVYRLRPDDAIGQARVLAVLSTGVLIGYRDRLRFWPTEPARVLKWIMAWGSRWAIVPARRAATPPRPPPTPGPRRR